MQHVSSKCLRLCHDDHITFTKYLAQTQKRHKVHFIFTCIDKFLALCWIVFSTFGFDLFFQLQHLPNTGTKSIGSFFFIHKNAEIDGIQVLSTSVKRWVVFFLFYSFFLFLFVSTIAFYFAVLFRLGFHRFHFRIKVRWETESLTVSDGSNSTWKVCCCKFFIVISILKKSV